MFVTIDTNFLQNEDKVLFIVQKVKQYMQQNYKEAIKYNKRVSVDILLKDLCKVTTIETSLKSMDYKNKDLTTVCSELSDKLQFNVKQLILSYLLECRTQTNILLSHLKNEDIIINNMITDLE